MAILYLDSNHDESYLVLASLEKLAIETHRVSSPSQIRGLDFRKYYAVLIDSNFARTNVQKAQYCKSIGTKLDVPVMGTSLYESDRTVWHAMGATDFISKTTLFHAADLSAEKEALASILERGILSYHFPQPDVKEPIQRM